MTVIQFDVLVPRPLTQPLCDRFQHVTSILVERGRLSAAEVTCLLNPSLAEGIEDQLRATFREEHDERDMDDAHVARYELSVGGVEGSLNQLTMELSRLLTPQAKLPNDPVLLENEKAHELPAYFPWTVEIRR